MSTSLQIRPATIDDLPQVLHLNQSAIPHVSSLTSESLRQLFDAATWFGIALLDGAWAGFLIALRPNAAYRSDNYLWFVNHFSDFLYIDRVCVAPEARRRSVACRLYADVENVAREQQIPLVTCEVNLKPENPPSLAFHDRHQFKEISKQETEARTKLVSLRVKHLSKDPIQEINHMRL